MSIYSYDPAERYRRRSVQRMTSVIGFLVFFGAIVGFGVWIGQIYSQQKMYMLQEQNKILLDDESDRQEEITNLRVEAQTSSVRLEQLRASYEELLSEGPMLDLVNILRQQLEKGVDPTRLESVILSARPPQNCSDASSKRFVVITPVYNGPGSEVHVDQVSVSGTGMAAKNTEGKNEAWFDPTQPVKVFFKNRTGGISNKEGVLPLYHSEIVRDKEYRFTISQGEKSFAKVTFDHCDYP